MVEFASVILAAGNGTRFLSETPKVLHKIGNAPLFLHVINTVTNIGCKNVILVTDVSYNTSKYTKSFDNVTEIYQAEKLGTGHALQLAYNSIKDNSEYVFLLYGDTPLITENTLSTALQRINADNSVGIAVIAMQRQNSESYGSLIITENGNVEAILEKGLDNYYSGKISDYCNSGLLIKKSILDHHLMLLQKNKFRNEILVTDLINISFASGYKNIIVEGSKEELIGINTRSELVKAEKIFQNRMRKYFIEHGVTLLDPDSVYFSHDTKICEDVTIYHDVFFGINVHIGPQNTIFPFSHIEDITTDESVQIGPFARIRGGVYLSAKSEIGNFVEVKKSNIGQSTKVKHLSYIGDAEIGQNCNVGAGTVTCNYDGVSKFKTTVEDNVFIGSNSTFIAPVEIQSNSIIGAGSVITKNVYKFEMAISRSEQKNIQNAAKRYFEKRKKI